MPRSMIGHRRDRDPYGALLSRLLWPAWEHVVRHRSTPTLLAHLEATQWRSQDEIAALQTAELSKLLSHAARHVPYYQRIFRERGIVPEEISGPADLPRLPILTRDEAQASTEERLTTAPPLPAIAKSTSGSLGMPLSFRYDRGSEAWRQATRLRGYAWAGYPLGARSLHFWGVRPISRPWAEELKVFLDHALKREHYLDCTPRGEEYLADAVAALRRLSPHVLVAYSQAAVELARYVLRTGCRSWDTIPVICGAEGVTRPERSLIERAFGPAVFETYGSREFMLIAAECEAHEGLHVAMENLVVEVVVREGDRERPAEPGEVGEVLVTDLHNLAMPFIRYAIGDLAVPGPPVPCPCGRGLQRLERIEGRVAQTLRDASGRPVSGLVFSILVVEHADLIRQFQVVQHGDRSLTLRLIPWPDAHIPHLTRAVEEHTERYLPGLPVRVELVEEIPVTAAGKRAVVVVEEA